MFRAAVRSTRSGPLEEAGNHFLLSLNSNLGLLSQRQGTKLSHTVHRLRFYFWRHFVVSPFLNF